MNILEKLELHPNSDVESNRHVLIEKFKKDSLLFKSVLRDIFLIKLSMFFGREIEKSTKINGLIPRSRRHTLPYEIESFIDVKFPKMVLSRFRIYVVISLYVIPFTLFLFLIENQSNLIVYILGILLLTGITGFALSFVIVAISPFFLEPLDFNSIETVDDLLLVLSIENSSDYSMDDFKLTIDEIDGIRQHLSASHELK